MSMAVRNAMDSAPPDKNAADMWLALCYFAKPSGAGSEAVASLAQLAAVARVSVETAKKGIRRLTESGMIAAERVTSGGRIMSTRYFLAAAERQGTQND